MKNYSLLRFLKLNLYFFLTYMAFTAIWYGVNGRFKEDGFIALVEMVTTAVVFALLFGTAIILWYNRTERRIPLKSIAPKELDKKLLELGFERKTDKSKTIKTYKPVPPKAPSLAGKIFILQSANFYHLHGPARFLKKL